MPLFDPTHAPQRTANVFSSSPPANPGAGIAKQIAGIAAAAFAGLASFFLLPPPLNLLAICALGAIGMIGARWQSAKTPWRFEHLHLPGNTTSNHPSHHHPASRRGNNAAPVLFANATQARPKSRFPQEQFEHKEPSLVRSFSTHGSGAALQPHTNFQQPRRAGRQGPFASGADASGRLA